jgi:gamma-glutamylcyclotransferase (GGCT)/AIG2-like uncharacterized protein YtfP
MKVAVYGTLRREGRFWSSYIAPTEPLGTTTLQGYEMRSLISYPFVVPEQGKSITIEVFDVTARQASNMARMEQRAGYEVEIVNTEFGDALLFYMDPYSRVAEEERSVVESGDWIEYTRRLNDKEEKASDS